MIPLRRTAAAALVVLILTVALDGCGDAQIPSPEDDPASSTPTHAAGIDLSAIGCATDDPDGVGPLTGAWEGSDGGVYYIRQVGDCVWWFGTGIEDLEPGALRQPDFANVASGRLVGTQLVVEYADLPVGDILGGGGLTFLYDEEDGELALVDQRGDWRDYNGSLLTRIEPDLSPEASPRASASP